MAGCGAELEANGLINDLTQDAEFSIPKVDITGSDFVFPSNEAMHKVVEPLTIADMTTGDVAGPGVFDALMRGFKAHLLVEFDKGRITGSDYTKAYIALTESAMNHGVAFLMGKDTAFWQSQMAQIQAFNARVQLEQTKVQLTATQFEASTQKANYALTKMKLSTESAAYCGQQISNDTATFNLSDILPQQLKNMVSSGDGQQIANDTATFNLSNILPQQLSGMETSEAGQKIANDAASYNFDNILPQQLKGMQATEAGQKINNDTSSYNLTTILPQQYHNMQTSDAGQVIANNTASYNLATMLPQQLSNLLAQNTMIKEQAEAQRAQTVETRTDGASVLGVLGKQKELYAQQITSYQRDAEMKVAKIFSDAWITQKTVDEGLTPPPSFTNAEIEKVLTDVRNKNGLGA